MSSTTPIDTRRVTLPEHPVPLEDGEERLLKQLIKESEDATSAIGIAGEAFAKGVRYHPFDISDIIEDARIDTDPRDPGTESNSPEAETETDAEAEAEAETGTENNAPTGACEFSDCTADAVTRVEHDTHGRIALCSSHASFVD